MIHTDNSAPLLLMPCSSSFKVSVYNELSNHIFSLSDLKMCLWLFSLYESFENSLN